MKGHQADHPIATVCRVLGVSPSGYYAWRQRAPSARAQRDAELTMQLQAIHLESREAHTGRPGCTRSWPPRAFTSAASGSRG